MNKIKDLRKKQNIKQTELCKMLGITQGALSGWENEKYEPDITSIKKMAKIFNVSIDYLLGRNESVKSNAIKIPVLGRVVAGIPLEAIEDILDYEEISREMAESGDYFALSIKGDSMEPRMQEGDVVIVRKQPDADTGDIAIVLVNGDEATIKKIKKQNDGISLIPSNPKYDIMFYTNSEIETKPVNIIGKVVELRAKF